MRIGAPVIARRWGADTIKAAIADERITRLSEAIPDEVNHQATRIRNQLRELGWRPPEEEDGFAAGQPRFVFQLPVGGKTPEQLLSGMNQLWRRNIKKAAKSGVVVRRGSLEDLGEFHVLYVETAERDHFTPRPLAYFQTMFSALQAEDPDRIRLYLAHHEDDLVAATTWVRVGEHAWYSYGASSTAKRDVRGSNAIQWQMITDALEAGATVYDLRGITEGLEADDPASGPDPVQGGHRRRGGGVPRRVGSAVESPAVQGVRPLHEAPLIMGGVVLRLDGPRWREHLQTVSGATPGMVPVIKGNGYGYGLRRLAEESTNLGVDVIAVGTALEVAVVRERLRRRRGDLEPVGSGEPAGRGADQRSSGDHHGVAAGRSRAIERR